MAHNTTERRKRLAWESGVHWEATLDYWLGYTAMAGLWETKRHGTALGTSDDDFGKLDAWHLQGYPGALSFCSAYDATTTTPHHHAGTEDGGKGAEVDDDIEMSDEGGEDDETQEEERMQDFKEDA